MHRKPEQAAIITDTGTTPAPGDLITDSIEEFAARMRGRDAVVFSAGAHGTGMDQTTVIDGKELEKAATAAAQARVSTFVLVSAFPESERGRFLSDGYEHYVRVKRRQTSTSPAPCWTGSSFVPGRCATSPAPATSAPQWQIR